MNSVLTDFLKAFNDITAPIGFIITICTFFLARATKGIYHISTKYFVRNTRCKQTEI